MARIILDAETAKTPIGEMLRTATESEIELTDESGKLVARIVLASGEENGVTLVFGGPDGQRLLIEREIDLDDPQEVEEIRRRASSSRDGDVTTAELLDRLNKLAAG